MKADSRESLLRLSTVLRIFEDEGHLVVPYSVWPIHGGLIFGCLWITIESFLLIWNKNNYLTIMSHVRPRGNPHAELRFVATVTTGGRQGCISCGMCSYPELTKDHVLTSAYVNIFRTVTRNAVNKSV